MSFTSYNLIRALSIYLSLTFIVRVSSKAITYDTSILSNIGCSKLATKSHPLFNNYKCQVKRPDLFEPKQCPESSCFCVNVTDGSRVPLAKQSGNDLFCDIYTISINLVVDARTWAEIKEKQDLDLKQELTWELNKVVGSTSADSRIVQFRRRDKDTAGSLFYYFDVELELMGPEMQVQNLMKLIESRIADGYFGRVPVNSNLTMVTKKLKPYPEPDLASLALLLKNDKNGLVVQNPNSVQMDLPNSQNEVYLNEDNSDRGKWEKKNDQNDLYNSMFWWLNAGRMGELIKQPGVLAGIIGSAITITLLLALLIVFCVYRLRKRDEGSYALDEPKKLLTSPASPGSTSYARGATREFYA